MKLKITQSSLKGTIAAPTSKSYAHRLLLLGALSNGSITISNIPLCSDVFETIECLHILGKEIEINDFSVTLKGTLSSKDFVELNINESASTLRFIIPFALLFTKHLKINVSERLFERGIITYEELFKDKIKIRKGKYYFELCGELTSDQYLIKDTLSSQYVSGLLLTLPFLNNESSLIIPSDIQSKDYINITLDCLKKANVIINNSDDNTYVIQGNQKSALLNQVVETDYSNVAVLEATKLLFNDFQILNLSLASLQGDIRYKEYFDTLKNCDETINISNSIDLGPILFVVASIYHGGTFIGVNRLKNKESNRIETMKEELNKFGVLLTYENDKVTIKGKPHSPKELILSHNDHRVATALIVLLLYVGGEIDGVECLNKSYPNFLNDLLSLGANIVKE